MMMGRKTRSIIQITLDVLLFVTLCALFVLSFKLLSPYHGGFSCDDDSIKKPYVGDTVNLKQLIMGGLVSPIVMIIIVEMLYTRSESSSGFCWSGVKSSLSLMGIFLYGLMGTLFLTELGKVTVGRMRPHFMDTCKPEYNTEDCAQGYVIEYNCTNTNISSRRLEDAYKSFPSGHSSASAFAALYIVVLCHYRIKTHLSYMLKFMVQGVAIGLALFSGLSRVRDNRHHLSDVMAGFLLGALVAVWIFRSVTHRIFNEKRKSRYEGSRGDVAYMEALPDTP